MFFFFFFKRRFLRKRGKNGKEREVANLKEEIDRRRAGLWRDHLSRFVLCSLLPFQGHAACMPSKQQKSLEAVHAP